MPKNVSVIVNRPVNGQVCDVESSDSTGTLYVSCSAERLDNGDPPDYVMAKIYDMSANLPGTPPMDATDLLNDFDYEFYGDVWGCPCGTSVPLPQFRVAFWAGIEDPQTGDVTWDPAVPRSAYGHVHEDLSAL
jgi:hypothetical protein